MNVLLMLAIGCVPYDVLDQGEDGGSEDPDPTDCTGDGRDCCHTLAAELARSEDEADALLARSLPDAALPDLFDVDWTERSVVAVYPAGACPNTGFRLHVGRVTAHDETLVVHGSVSGGRRGNETESRPYEVLLVHWTGAAVEAR